MGYRRTNVLHYQCFEFWTLCLRSVWRHLHMVFSITFCLWDSCLFSRFDFMNKTKTVLIKACRSSYKFQNIYEASFLCFQVFVPMLQKNITKWLIKLCIKGSLTCILAISSLSLCFHHVLRHVFFSYNSNLFK